jgi:hypothetical protein
MTINFKTANMLGFTVFLLLLSVGVLIAHAIDAFRS